MTDLVFSDSRLIGSPTPLVFGVTDFVIASVTVDAAVTLDGVTVAASLVQPVNVDAAITLGGVGVSAFVVTPVRIDAACTLGGVSVAVTCFYDNRVTPWLDMRAAAQHNPATPAVQINESAWDTTKAMRGGNEAPWAIAVGRVDQVVAQQTTAVAKRAAHATPWELAIQKAQASAAAHQKAVFKTHSRASGWQLGEDRRIDTASAMQAGVFKVLDKTGVWQRATETRRLYDNPVGASLRYSGVLLSSEWQLGGFPLPGHFVPPVVPPVVPTFWWGSDLVFECPPLAFPALVFGGLSPCQIDPSVQTTLFILPARFYMTINDVFAQRLPDLAEIPIYDPTISADEGSYCWTLSATGPASLFELLAPVGGLPVQLRVTMNGIPWVFAVDSLQRTQVFGKTGVSISGRSVTALIGAPYMRAMMRDNASNDRMAQQLALAALQDTGVDLDWGLTDWLVPAGAWSHQGTPLDAVQAIAQAAGGYLQSHRSAATLMTRHPYSQRQGDYPGAPWGWMTGPADVELAPDAIITDGTECKDGPDINAIYVSGTTQGVLGFVKRTGSAGDKLAAMVTDPLITDVIAARQRGLAVLGAAGAKYDVRLELPVLTGVGQPGVIDVGKLVQINASTPWRGRVRSVRVNHKRPILRQIITLERHLEIA